MKELAHQKSCTDIETLKLPHSSSTYFRIIQHSNLEAFLPETQSLKHQKSPSKRKILTST